MVSFANNIQKKLRVEITRFILTSLLESLTRLSDTQQINNCHPANSTSRSPNESRKPNVMMTSLTKLLAGVLLLSVSTKSAPIDGKENVFDYQISVGKETGNLFKPGFIIDTKVIVRKHSDNTYNLQVNIP